MASDPKYKTPRVPHNTPMYEDPPTNKKMSRTWIIFFERLALWESENEIETGGGGEKKATFGLLRELTVEQDLTNHYISRTSGVFTSWAINAKLPPIGSSATLDILLSTDEGITWNSIFTGGVKPILPDGAEDITEGNVFSLLPQYNRIQPNNLLRIDCLAKGSGFAGQYIEVVLLWE